MRSISGRWWKSSLVAPRVMAAGLLWLGLAGCSVDLGDPGRIVDEPGTIGPCLDCLRWIRVEVPQPAGAGGPPPHILFFGPAAEPSEACAARQQEIQNALGGNRILPVVVLVGLQFDRGIEWVARTRLSAEWGNGPPQWQLELPGTLDLEGLTDVFLRGPCSGEHQCESDEFPRDVEPFEEACGGACDGRRVVRCVEADREDGRRAHRLDVGACSRVAVPEDCDGADNDCDGAIDESLAPRDHTCDDHPCAPDVIARCEQGMWSWQCPEVDPEVCDGDDNDCDGATDEGVLNPCGACGPVPEDVCDGEDNDCNGVIDDPRPCYGGPPDSLGVGVCHAGETVCHPPSGLTDCVGQTTPGLEVIRGPHQRGDEDCDGAVDEIDVGCLDCQPGGVSVSVEDLDAAAPLGVIVALLRPSPVPEGAAERRADVHDRVDRVLAEAIPLAGRLGGHLEVLRRYESLYVVAVEADRAALEILLANPRVESVHVDVEIEPALVSATAAIGVDAVWRDRGFGGLGSTIAVVDTGLDLAAFGCAAVGEPGCPIIAGRDAHHGRDDIGDPTRHGTAMALVAAGRGPVPGVAPSAQLIAVKVTDDDGHAHLRDLLAGLDWLVDRPALAVDVVNISLATPRGFDDTQGCADYARILARPIADLSARGALTVAAAGNAPGLAVPACAEGLLAIGGSYPRETNGPVVLGVPPVCVDGQDAPMLARTPMCISAGLVSRPEHPVVVAPGYTVGVGPPDDVRALTGTSVSAALGSGAVAALISSGVSGPAQIMGLVVESALETPDIRARVRHLDLPAALALQCIAGGAGPERCDARDNDCDGAVDEGLRAGELCAAGVGACRREGRVICTPAGDETCDAEAGDPVGEGEAPDGRDNDCDGVVDEQACRLIEQVLDASSLPHCNDFGGLEEQFAECLQDNQQGCAQAVLNAWCSRQSRPELWAGIVERNVDQVFADEGCERWQTMRMPDSGRVVFCIEFADGICPESNMWFEF